MKESERFTSRSFIADAALRLQNWAGIKGTLRPQLQGDPDILPVVIVGNLTEGFQGPTGQLRRWTFVDTRVANSGTYIVADTIAGLIIDDIILTCSGTTTMTLAIGGPGSGTRSVAGNGSRFVDDLRSAAEVGPLATNATTVAGTAFGVYDLTATTSIVVPCGFFMGEGMFLTLTSSAAAVNGRFAIRGRAAGRR